MFNKNLKKCICLGLSLIMLLTVTCIGSKNIIYYVKAASVSENQARKNELKNQSDSLRSKIADIKNNIDDQQKYKETLDQQISVLQEQIDLSNNQIAELDSRIEKMQSDIIETQKQIEKNYKLLKQRLKAIYVAGDTSTLEVILGAKDFNDFLDKAEIVKNVGNHDSALINSLKSDINSISQEKQQIEADRQTVSDEKKSLDQNQQELQTLLDESNRVISELQGQKSRLLDQIDENDAEMQKIQSEIEQYYANQNQNNDNNNDVPVPSGNGYAWPVPGYTYISSDYYDSEGRSSIHGAIDIAGGGIYGKPVVAAADGVVFSGCIGGWGGGYGTYLAIDHGNGKSTLYAHMSGAAVSIGSRVTRGQVIGYVGSTGYSTGPHLHFETRLNGVKYNPMTEF